MKVGRESNCNLNLDSSEKITQFHCDYASIACSLFQATRWRQWIVLSGIHLSDLRAYGSMFPKRRHMVCLETVVAVAKDI